MTFLHPFCCLSMIMSDVRFPRKKVEGLEIRPSWMVVAIFLNPPLSRARELMMMSEV